MQRNSIVEQFEFNARTAPDAIALEREGQAAVTYGDLNRQANRIAHALIAAGVQARGKSIVGLFLPAGTDYVAALLAVAKTGAVFLPLPPDLPGLRLAAYMDMAGVEHLVTDAEHAGLLEERLVGLERKAAVIRSDTTGEGTESDPGHRHRAGRRLLRHVHVRLDGRPEGYPGSAARPQPFPQMGAVRVWAGFDRSGFPGWRRRPSMSACGTSWSR